jgi:hypothetical protein
MITTIFILLIVYQIKHFLADYLLQGKYMLGKFSPGWEFFNPLLAHCNVHGWMTFVIALIATSNSRYAAFLALLDLVIHFIMDRIKAGPKYLGRFKSLSENDFERHEMDMKSLGDFENIQSVRDVMGRTNKRWDKSLRNNKLFWWCLGLDQMVHHLTHYLIIYLIIEKSL